MLGEADSGYAWLSLEDVPLHGILHVDEWWLQS